MSAKLIVALDVGTLQEARKLVNRLWPKVKIFKVGSQLFTACGPVLVSHIIKKGGQVFLDLKYHDIPNTVAKAAAAATRLGVFMITLHASGGRPMLEAAGRASREACLSGRQAGRFDRKPLLVAVTVLTSFEGADVTGRVLELARLAKDSGLDGVVASALECQEIKKELGKDFLVVTPGIRPQGSAAQDQRRAATPQEAVWAGSDFLVVGRPVIEAKDPLAAAKQILKEMA